MDRPRLLVVDDHKQFTQMLEVWLRPTYDVSVARDGEEGLELAASLSPDLLLVDIMMPRMSGLEMLEALGERRELAGIPVIVMSAYADMQDPRIIEALRPWVVLQKPFSQADLVECIGAILGRPGAGPAVIDEGETKALVGGLMEELEQNGLEIVQAAAGDYPRPPKVRGYAPDVVGYDREGDLLHFGIALTAPALAAPASRLRIRKLSDQVMGEGTATGAVIPLSIMVPRGHAIAALQLLKDMGLVSRHMHDIFIIQAEPE